MSTGVVEEGVAPVLADGGIAVEAVGLGKQYRRRLGLRAGAWALRDCSFALPAGRVAALVGANGAGKTTLLSIIAGLLTPSVGSVVVGGTEPGGTPRSACEAAGRVAFVAPAVEPPWTTRPVNLEDLVLAHLSASKESVA